MNLPASGRKPLSAYLQQTHDLIIVIEQILALGQYQKKGEVNRRLRVSR
jgi:hypothetical protein